MSGPRQDFAVCAPTTPELNPDGTPASPASHVFKSRRTGKRKAAQIAKVRVAGQLASETGPMVMTQPAGPIKKDAKSRSKASHAKSPMRIKIPTGKRTGGISKGGGGGDADGRGAGRDAHAGAGAGAGPTNGDAPGGGLGKGPRGSPHGAGGPGDPYGCPGGGPSGGGPPVGLPPRGPVVHTQNGVLRYVFLMFTLERHA